MDETYYLINKLLLQLPTRLAVGDPLLDVLALDVVEEPHVDQRRDVADELEAESEEAEGTYDDDVVPLPDAGRWLRPHPLVDPRQGSDVAVRLGEEAEVGNQRGEG